jgi:hypothetical protein
MDALDADQRELARLFNIEKLFKKDGVRQEYFALVDGAAKSIERFLDYEPSPRLVAEALAPVIVHRQDFVKHVRSRSGGPERLTDREALQELALAAAGTAVAEYRDRTKHA